MQHYSSRDFEKAIDTIDCAAIARSIDLYEKKYKTPPPNHILNTVTRDCYNFSALSSLHTLCLLPNEIWIGKLTWSITKITTDEGRDLYASIFSNHRHVIGQDCFARYLHQALTEISQTDTARGAKMIEKINELIPLMSQAAKNELYAFCAMSHNDYLYSLKGTIGKVDYNDVVAIWEETTPSLRINPESIQNERLKTSLSELSRDSILETLAPSHTAPTRSPANKRKI